MHEQGAFVDVVEVTFVDDEAASIVASTPAALDKAIDVMLDSFGTAFADFGLVINWAKGKSEALLLYRGKNAASHLDRRRVNGEIVIQVPGNLHLHVVTKYKHLGGFICVDGNIIPEMTNRCSYPPMCLLLRRFLDRAK